MRILAALLLLLLATQVAASETVFVTRVIDGDTIELEDGRRVRLRGIDAPELHDEYGKISKAKLELYVLDRRVSLHDPKAALYDRTEAIVQWSRFDVGALMLLHGHARHWERYTKGEQRKRYTEVQQKAIAQSRGLWAGAVGEGQVVSSGAADNLFPPFASTVASPTPRASIPQGQVIYYSAPMPTWRQSPIFLPSASSGAVCTGPDCNVQGTQRWLNFRRK